MKSRHLILSGFMGTGKSTLAPLVARELGLPWVDADAEVERTAGRSIAEIWAADGEAGFRALESRTVRALLGREAPHVVALGGGTVADRELRRLAQSRGVVVTLEASREVLDARLAGATNRPNIGGEERTARLAGLLEARSERYAECHARIDTGRLDVRHATLEATSAYRRDAVLVPLGKRSYTVEVVHDAPGRLVSAVEELSPSRVVLVTDAIVERAREAHLDETLKRVSVPVTRVALPSGERHKSLESVEVLWSAAIGAAVDRRSVFLAFGGGVVCDLAGFAASTVLRGVRWVASPTTLLAMVDAAIGGKTGFDFAGGKNLVGSFHQPSGVLCDVAHLATLPARERTAGLAEVVKMGLVADAALVEAIHANAADIGRGDPDVLRRTIHQAVSLKARCIADDELDAGARALLNAGHTVGHALEAHGGFSRHKHGEAVAIGLCAELAAAERLGLADPCVRAACEKTLAALGLPTRAPAAEVAAAWRHVCLDKKRHGEEIDWPIVARLGEGKVVRVRIDALGAALLAS